MAQDGNNGVDLVNEARKRDFKKALSQVPQYTGTTPWRLWKMEFALWLRVYEVVEDEATKLALLTSMRGAAVQKISPYGCTQRRGTSTPPSRVTWRKLSRYLLHQQSQIYPRSSSVNVSRAVMRQ